MKRTSPKRASPKKKARKLRPTAKSEDTCAQCDRRLGHSERALYVEEEVGRTFCSEDCIAGYFAPDIERLEKEYFKHLPKDDLPAEDREKNAQLRWPTLQDPQEIWREKTLAGDFRYALVSEYKQKGRTLWSICICLLLRGEPSFLYMALVTRKEELVDRYRRGERVQRVLRKPEDADQETPEEPEEEEEPTPSDGLGEPWTPDEVQRAERIRAIGKDDIPVDHYAEYEKCVEPTLEKPDEIWAWETEAGKGTKTSKHYHFIKRFEEEDLWYIIVARETTQEDQLEIMDLFPTRDLDLVGRYRKGEQELGEEEEPVFSRMVH